MRGRIEPVIKAQLSKSLFETDQPGKLINCVNGMNENASKNAKSCEKRTREYRFIVPARLGKHNNFFLAENLIAFKY